MSEPTPQKKMSSVEAAFAKAAAEEERRASEPRSPKTMVIEEDQGPSEIEQFLDKAADRPDIRTVTIRLADGREQTFRLSNPMMDWVTDQSMDAMQLLYDLVDHINTRIDALDELKEVLAAKGIKDEEINDIISRIGDGRSEVKINLMVVLRYAREHRLMEKFLSVFYVPDGAEYEPENAEKYHDFYRRFKTMHITGALGNFFGGIAGSLGGDSLASLLPLIPSLFQKTPASDVARSAAAGAS